MSAYRSMCRRSDHGWSETELAGISSGTTFGSGSQAKFRVRVGKYADRREAETVAGRLKKEEEFNTWITR